MSRHGDEDHVCAPDFVPGQRRLFPESFFRDVEHNQRRIAKRERDALAQKAKEAKRDG